MGNHSITSTWTMELTSSENLKIPNKGSEYSSLVRHFPGKHEALNQYKIHLVQERGADKREGGKRRARGENVRLTSLETSGWLRWITSHEGERVGQENTRKF